MDNGRRRMARLFREQADGCGRLGSPFYAGLLAQAADDIDNGGVVADVLADHEQDPGPSALALRLAGAVHRLVLDGRADDLSAYYPSVGGVADVAAAWPAFTRTLAERFDEVRGLLGSPPQTNEVGRAAVLLGALLDVVDRTGLPVRLLEVGASAGLNLRVEHFRYELDEGTVVGRAESPVVLRHPWERGGTWPPVHRPLRVTERLGCDADPVDPLTDEGRLRLTSYVWPDQRERLERLRGAFAVAAAVPAVVERMGAAAFLRRELATPRPGVVTVVWHSVVWQYLDRAERDAVVRALAGAAGRASAEAPLAVVSFEPRRIPGEERFAFLASQALSPGQEERLIGEGQGHGPPVRWF
jgi:hypothetical protein